MDNLPCVHLVQHFTWVADSVDVDQRRTLMPLGMVVIGTTAVSCLLVQVGHTTLCPQFSGSFTLGSMIFHYVTHKLSAAKKSDMNKINKMPFLKHCLGSLLARLIQLLDTTDGLVKTRRSRFALYVAIALRLDPFQISIILL